ncbi:gluconate 2-dehydrogenase subunit 3 family protein [Gelidibacter maritimus]|uniref:Gluconate 2-dehydrogenase subunit 3 family protein n=1 Tax=Gelidibacter maritimus TaxID=2761487 RepID=A0A7W2R5R3_9FLAO|nr:gluconate 2-dehydrogenase subunit 3 family protein [Gelidibacter maritimus]MBA6154405.1 gluconate 2-dehydrogenase subunit 3 family protein [Gelidibacter maritimus]
MNRREALKGLGLSLGYVIATPTILGMLQSCTTSAEKWTPLFHSENQAHVLERLVDLILPKTKDAPGALDVHVPKFIDLYIHETLSDADKDLYQLGFDAVMSELGVLDQAIDPEQPITLKEKDYDAILSKYLRISKAQRITYIEAQDLVFMTLSRLRDQSVWAYKTSREIGKNVLAYDPVPGVQKGCISVEEATGGKAWSL